MGKPIRKGLILNSYVFVKIIRLYMMCFRWDINFLCFMISGYNSHIMGLLPLNSFVITTVTLVYISENPFLLIRLLLLKKFQIHFHFISTYGNQQLHSFEKVLISIFDVSYLIFDAFWYHKYLHVLMVCNHA